MATDRAGLRERLQAALGTTYAIERELGGGGMSHVFVAAETALGRRVVVKVLPPDSAASVSAARFRREIAVAARLQHPHIVPLLSTGEMDGIPYFTMPFVEGESLRVRVARSGELPAGEAVRILREIASALTYAHGHGVVHRDIKPDNVLLSGDVAMVTDFGVARALSAATLSDHGATTSIGVAIGTPGYMAPEQASADPALDHRADVYAFGVLAYEVLSGSPPFAGRSVQATLAAHIVEAPEPITKRRPGLPPALAALVMQCLEKRPCDRPQSAAELVRALDALGSPSGDAHVAAGRRSAPGARRIGVLAVGVGLLLAAGVAVVRRTGSPTAKATLPPTAVEVPATSLAVLPLANIGGDTADEYFAQGMADELTGALARVPGLRVASRTTAAGVQRRRPDADAREVGRLLGVSAVLEGAVRRAPGRLRLTAQLTSVENGLLLWAETYERGMQDVFVVQDDIARSIVAALRPRLALQHGVRLGVQPAHDRDATVGPIAVAGTRDVEAHELYLRGRYLWARRTRLEEATALLRGAIARDSNYAQAYAALAALYVTLPDWTLARVDTTSLRAIAYARRALALDATLGEAHAALGGTYVNQGRIADAEREFQLALAADDGDATTHMWYGFLLAGRGRSEEALRELRRAHELDPLAPNILGNYAQALATAGQPEEAERRLRAAVATEPALWLGYLQLAGVLVAAGRAPEAAAYADSGLRLGGAAATKHQNALGVAGLAYARSGRSGEARRALARVRALGTRDDKGIWSQAEAMILVGLGQPDSALAALRREVERGHVAMLQYVAIIPSLAVLRDDPRYAELYRQARFRP